MLATAISACFAANYAIANPTGGAVVSGTAINQPLGKVLNVTNSNGATINWQTFSIAQGETTRFIQPTASSAVMNKVLSADPSLIYGQLTSNGKVWLINPAGILVGASGKVDTAGFVASTLGVSQQDFLAGRINMTATPGAGDVVNNGSITSPSGGSVYLIGANVLNNGVITTPQGETILAAGATVHLVDSATPGVRVEITGAEGNATNLGEIAAEAGRIGIAGVIARNSGNLNASSVVSEGGRVFLKASQDAYVDGAGRIVTTGTKGGSVDVLGNRVAVMDNASIDASGTAGDGGKVRIGGGYQGKDTDVTNSQITYVGRDTEIKANAGSVGAGGTVIVWSDDTTRAFGKFEARGGSTSGQGGLVETSSKRGLDVTGIRVDTRAADGSAGNWLLDPTDVTILANPGVAVGGDFDIVTGIFDNFTGTTATIPAALLTSRP
ncbi:MAG: filamentous hemagglutinin N-terminal domain-containing protein [Rhodocyclaceae bacterium]|nr:filamentous hemagglutinin N-terminal domain-containing protein [Rhodocyclaceae bacterium]